MAGTLQYPSEPSAPTSTGVDSGAGQKQGPQRRKEIISTRLAAVPRNGQ